MMQNRATAADAGTRHRTDTAAPIGDRTGGAALILRVTGYGVLTAGLLLAACSPNPVGPGASKLRTYAVDLAGGAKVCEVPLVKPVAGQTSDAAIKLANDGGWCALGVQQDGVKPFGAGLLMTRPSHGTVVIHAVGDGTRIDYTPDRGFAGTDAFAVKLKPGNATVRVDVTVTARQS